MGNDLVILLAFNELTRYLRCFLSFCNETVRVSLFFTYGKMCHGIMLCYVLFWLSYLVSFVIACIRIFLETIPNGVIPVEEVNEDSFFLVIMLNY